MLGAQATHIFRFVYSHLSFLPLYKLEASLLDISCECIHTNTSVCLYSDGSDMNIYCEEMAPENKEGEENR